MIDRLVLLSRYVILCMHSSLCRISPIHYSIYIYIYIGGFHSEWSGVVVFLFIVPLLSYFVVLAVCACLCVCLIMLAVLLVRSHLVRSMLVVRLHFTSIHILVW